MGNKMICVILTTHDVSTFLLNCFKFTSREKLNFNDVSHMWVNVAS